MLLSVLLQEFGSLIDVLLWIVGAGGSMWIVGKLKARFLENLTFWHNFSPLLKKIITWVLAALLGVSAQILIEIDVTQYIPVWLSASLLSAINWYFGQKEYQEIKDSGYGETTRVNAANNR